MRKILAYTVFMTALLAAAGTAKADLINFEVQGAGAPSSLTGTLNSPLVIGIATFTGGQLLNHEILGVDQTAVYATGTFLFGAYTDPLTIHFSAPVSGFSIDVTNELGDTFTVADNRGGSSTTFVATNTTHLFTLTDSGITSVTIGSTDTLLWDFAIDNVQFTPQTSSVPEPASLLFLASACVAIGKLVRRRSR
jgi:hypothetical protein